MENAHPALHPFKVAPKTFGRIGAENVSQTDDNKKSDKRFDKPGIFRSVVLIAQSQNQPSAGGNHYQNSENKRFAGNKRKK